MITARIIRGRVHLTADGEKKKKSDLLLAEGDALRLKSVQRSRRDGLFTVKMDRYSFLVIRG